MKLVIQRVSNAKVEVENKIIGQIEKGFLVLLGVVGLIVFPIITETLRENKEDLYNAQIEEIKLAAEKWAYENIELLQQVKAGIYYQSEEEKREQAEILKTLIENLLDKAKAEKPVINETVETLMASIVKQALLKRENL